MALWKCGIAGCEAEFDGVEETIVHQTTEHERHECKVCGTLVPEGYFAIRHALDEHTRAEYVRAYDADSSAVRRREKIKADIEREADLERVVERLDERP
jgi:DNA repair exonuclease SbcCD ATPase subunit